MECIESAAETDLQPPAEMLDTLLDKLQGYDPLLGANVSLLGLYVTTSPAL
jgi:hypothetical protein